MLLPSLALVSGLIILVISSDKFIENTALIAEKLKVSPIVIGFTLVALGTSAPEMVVSAIASIDMAPEIAIGNVLGSNIANVALVFGATLLFGAIPITKGLSVREVPILFGVTLLSGVLILDGVLGVVDGILLIVSFCLSLYLLLRSSQDLGDELTQELPEDDGASIFRSITLSVLGLIALIGSSKLLVWGAIEIAASLGVSELIIGLTIVAIGTSLPELAASITSALKGHHDIALGNILGSNLFNLATVLPLPALISPSILTNSVTQRDYWWMLGTTLVFLAAIVLFNKTQSKAIPKWLGYLFLTSYIMYLVSLYLGTSR